MRVKNQGASRSAWAARVWAAKVRGGTRFAQLEAPISSPRSSPQRSGGPACAPRQRDTAFIFSIFFLTIHARACWVYFYKARHCTIICFLRSPPREVGG